MQASFEYKGKNSKILSSTKILIVDDSKTQRMILVQMFSNYGFKNIFEAENGKVGLEKTVEVHPDLVLLDINMPVMDGFEYCEKIRQDESLKNISILVQTASEDKETKKQIFEIGADDYVSKPIDYNEIAARSFVHLERQVMIKELAEYKRRVDEELESAKNLQSLSMPSDDEMKKLDEDYGVLVNSLLKTSSELGGDCWGFHDLGDGFIQVYTADFAGHGINASLNTFRLHTLLKSNDTKKSDKKNPAKYIASLSKKLFSLLPIGQYATMFYGIIDIKNNKLNYTVAGCPSMILMRNKCSSCENIDGKGFPVASIENADYENYSTEFNKGDALFLYSDALIETEGKTKPEMNSEDLGCTLNNVFLGAEPQEIGSLFDVFVKNFLKEYGPNLNDDLTLSMYFRK